MKKIIIFKLKKLKQKELSGKSKTNHKQFKTHVIKSKARKRSQFKVFNIIII